MADLKRKQLRQFLSGSFNITGSLNVTGSVEFDKNISGSITSTGSFSRLQGDTISVTHSPFASGSGVQALMDATGSYASASTQYVKESQTGSFGSGSDVQGILDTYVRQTESSSFASGSDLQVILAESASYVTLNETSSFASGSDLQIILAESASYVSSNNTASLHQVLAESASYVVSTNTSSFLQNSDTASFSTLVVQGDITTSGSITAQSFNTEIVSSSVIFASGSTRFGDTIDDSHNMTGSLFVSGNITFDTNLTGSITSTASFGKIEVGDGGIDTAGDLTLDGDGGDIIFKDGGAEFGRLTQFLGALTIKTGASGNAAIIFDGDGNQFVGGEISSNFNIKTTANVSGGLSTTGSFHRLESNTISVTNSPFASGSDLQVILAESSSYVLEQETGSFASGSDLQPILAESASYLNNDTTSSLGKLTLVSDITGSITSTASFGRVDVAENTFILGNLGIGTSTQGNRLQVAGDASIVGALDVLNSVSGGLSSTGSFGHVEQLGVKLVDSNQTGSFASGSDLQPILARSSSYMISDETASMGTTTISDLFVQNDITTSGSITAREFKTEFVSSSIIFASGSQIFGNSEDDTHAFSGSVNIGDMVFSGSRVGVSSDLDLLTLSNNTLTINGSVVINDGANIGIDSDTNLLTLNDQNLVVNGILDSTGRIDAQNGLQVSGSSLQVGNDLTLDYTSAVSHSLVYVNYQDKTLDLVPVASASGQLVQFNGTDWIVSDEIDGGTF